MASSIRPIFIPEWTMALRADWAPGPGVLILFAPVAWSWMWRAVVPSSSYSQHGSTGRGRVSVSLHLHLTSHTADGFLARSISDMDKSVTEGCKDVVDTKHLFSFSYLRSEADDLFFLLFLPLERCHFCVSSPDSTTRKQITCNSLMSEI